MECSARETIRRTRAFFDERAAQWDTMISADHAHRLQRIIESLPIAPDARILDVGCGTGVLFPILAGLLDTRGCVVAVDVSFAMMRETRKRIAQLCNKQATPEHLLLQADVVYPPLRPGSFDWVICNSCFPHFHNQQQAVTAMAGLLSPAGTLIICHTESRAAINELHRTVGGAVGGHALPDAPEMESLVTAAGLQLETLSDQSNAYLLCARK